MTLDSEASVLPAGRGKTSSLSMLMDGVDDPVDSGVVSDSNVVRIDQDDLVVLEGGVLVDPVRVQDTEVHAGAAGSLLGNRSEVSDELDLVDAVVLGLAVNHSLVVGSLSAASANSDAVDHVALLGLVAELVGLVGTGGLVHLLASLALSVLPSTDSEQESQDITLLLAPDLL